MFNLPKINSEEEVLRITSFIKETFDKQKIKHGVIGISGGIDSATSLALLSRSIPKENILALYLPYFESEDDIEELIDSLGLSEDQLITFPIEEMVDEMIDQLEIPEEDLVRRGNIMARIRMILLYDFAKANNALVVGTENRSEYLLGYYTRFGDGASDIEPIVHLYKTQVYELAKHLSLLSSMINKAPSANLWENQTDEVEFGFKYSEADPVLYLYFDKSLPVAEIEKEYPSAKKIIDFANKNSYKHKVPYSMGG